MRWGYSAIVGFAHQGGFSTSQALIAAAIALAESGGDDHAYNPETQAGTPKGHGSRGLWQIYGYAHPEYDNDSMYDPTNNARAAHAVFIQQGWNAWSTYKTGAYIKYLQGNGTGGGNGAGGTGGAKGSGAQFASTSSGGDPCADFSPPAWCYLLPFSAAIPACNCSNEPFAPPPAAVESATALAAWLDPVRIIKAVLGAGFIVASLLGTFMASGAGKNVIQLAGMAMV